MKIKNILYMFLVINIVMAPAMHAMEQPDKQHQTEQLSRRLYPSYLPRLLLYGRKFEESYLSWLPLELIVEIINHARKIQTDQDLLNAKNNRKLLKAVKAINENKVKLLLNEPYIDVNVKDKRGNTPLIWASYKKNPEIVRMLLGKGASPNIQDQYGDTALIWAVKKNNLEIVQMLLDNGANPNIQDKFRDTALMSALIDANREIVQMLLDNGANPNIQDNNGDTALMRAITFDDPKIVQMLLDNGANPNIPNKDKWTPLNCAKMNELFPNYQAIINLLNDAEERAKKMKQSSRKSHHCILQ